MSHYYCSKCKAEITEKVYSYSLENYNCVLCRNCQPNSSTPIKEKKVESEGLSKHKSQFAENMIKGRIAETLIEELFLSLGYNVFRYGMENTVPGIMNLLKGVRSDVAKNIKSMPDFVIQKNGEVFFVEVKFRANETFSIKDLDPDYPFMNTFFIIVSKKHIKCITYEELKSGKEITPDTHNYLGNCKSFNLDKNVIIDFCNFATKFFEGV